MLTFETETYPSTGETVVFVVSSMAEGERAILAAFSNPKGAEEFAQFLRDAAHVRGYGPAQV